MRVLDRVIQAFAAAALLAVLLCVTLGIVTRALNEPLIWTDEGARFAMVWLAAAGWMLACRRGIHVRIRFFQDKLPARAHGAAEVLIQASLAVFGAVVAWQGVVLVEKSADLQATSMEISMAWLYAPLIPAGLVMAGQAVAEGFLRVRG